MKHLLESLNALRRPRLLIQAARIGAATYRRDLHLRRVLGPEGMAHGPAALAMLMEMEAAMNAARNAGGASYCAADHVDLLIAMMGEARLLRAMQEAGPSENSAPVRHRSR